MPVFFTDMFFGDLQPTEERAVSRICWLPRCLFSACFQQRHSLSTCHINISQNLLFFFVSFFPSVPCSHHSPVPSSLLTQGLRVSSADTL